MGNEDLKKRIERITSDKSKSVDDRIDEVFILRKENEPEEEALRLSDDVVYFRLLIEMLKEENSNYEYDIEMMQLYVLLAEVYVRKKEFRPIREIARNVLDLIRYEVVPWEVLEKAVPRIIDAVGETVYNHELYELLLSYIRRAYREGKLTPNFKGRARRLLKLRILLEESDWRDMMLDRGLEHAIAGFFTKDELLKIILHPNIGVFTQDPVEFTWRWENIFYDVEDRLEERFASAPRQMGFCFMYWNAKQDLLKEDYNIDWKSPAQMNPGVMFD